MVWTGGQLVEFDCLIDGLMNKAIGPFHGENNGVTLGPLSQLSHIGKALDIFKF